MKKIPGKEIIFYLKKISYFPLFQKIRSVEFLNNCAFSFSKD